MKTTKIIVSQLLDRVRVITYESGPNPYPFEGGVVHRRAVTDYPNGDIEGICAKLRSISKQIEIV